MPVYCCVPGCGTNSKRNRGLTFHGFPKEAFLREKWASTLGRFKRVTIHTKVCSLHFQDDVDFTTQRKSNSITRHRFLREGACPSRNIPTSLHRLTSPQTRLHQVCSPSKSAHSGALTTLQTVTREFSALKSVPVDANATSTMPNPSAKLKPLFGVDLMAEDQLVHYTGFSRTQLDQLWTLLALRRDPDSYKDCDLSGHDQLLLTLIKLRVNMSFKTLRITFGMSPYWASRVFHNWLHKMYILFKDMCYTCALTNNEDLRRHMMNNFAITSDLCEDHPLKEKILFVIACLHYFSEKKLFQKTMTVNLKTF